jgi:hypothetical protein
MSCNVVVIQKGDVLSTFERAIAAFSRPMDPDFVEGDQQVNRFQQHHSVGLHNQPHSAAVRLMRMPMSSVSP